MRSVLAAATQGNSWARLAIALFCYRLARALLGLTAALSSIDALIFTGGSGRTTRRSGAQVLTHLAILNPVLNEENGRESNGRISTESGLLCLVIPANEELMIARETDALTS
jgi:acetate kinase